MIRRALLLTALVATAATAGAEAREKFDVKVLAKVPPPGYPALSLVAPDRTIYVGTFTNANDEDTGPSKVFAFAPDGHLKREYTIEGQTPGKVHGVQTAQIDAQGRLYLFDVNPPRAIRLDPQTGKQENYATFPDLPPCMPGQTGNCSATLVDNPPTPNFGAWGPDGSLFATDYTQATIWRIPPGGGEAQVWLSDPRLDAGDFGPAGLVLMPDRRTLMVATLAGGIVTGDDPSTGKLYTLPIQPDGKPGELTKLYESGPREAPDGFAIAASGNIYLALVGPGVNQLVQIAPDGRELARISSPPDSEVPFDSPSSVQFDGERLIVTNDAFFTGDESHFVLFDIFAGEPGEPVFVPGVTRPSPSVVGSKKRYSLSVRPRSVKVGAKRRFRFTARIADAAGKRPLARAVVRFGGRRARTDARGVAVIRTRFARRGKRVARLLPAVGKRRTVAKALVRVRKR